MNRILVVGFGAAAHRLVARLRHHGHDGPVTVLGAGPHPAYQRALLPAVLVGPLPAAATRLPALPGLPDEVDVRLGVRATRLDRDRCVVVDDRGDEHRYDHAVLATGAAPRDGGLAGPGVRTLHTLDDALAPLGSGGRDVVVVGGGPRGVELAAALAGRRVTLVGAHERLLPGRLDDRGADRLADALRAGEGVLLLDDGTEVAAPEVIVAAGYDPADGLARAAGLAGRDHPGVPVDDGLGTADPRVHALGAVAVLPGADPGHLGSAWEQADVLARRLTGADARYRPTRVLTRLRVGDLDVVAAGTPTVGATTVTAADATRYARLELDDDGCLRHASVVGFPQAAGPLARYRAQRTPLPTDPVPLLLGVAAVPDGELADDAVVCVCNTVTAGQLRAAWDGGATDVAAIASCTRATTGCGTCAATVGDLLDRFAQEVPA